MRINQSMAKEVAIKMTEKKSKEVQNLKLEYYQFIHDEYVKKTPKPIIDALKKYPEWIATTNSIRFSGFGISIESLNTKTPVINNTTNYYAILEIDSVLANKIIKIRDKYIDAERKYKALRDKIETALNGLRTFAQVEKHLPEALPFLPKSSSMELVVNFDKLREEIQAA